MDTSFGPLLSFLAGELIFILVILWGYRQITNQHSFRLRTGERRLVLALFLLLPILLGYFTLPGILAQTRLPSGLLPLTGEEPAPDEAGQETAAITAAPSGGQAAAGTDSAPATAVAEAPSAEALALEGATASAAGSPTLAPTAPPPTQGSIPQPTAGTALPTPILAAEATAGTAAPAAGGEPQGHIVFVCQVFNLTEQDQVCITNADGQGWRRLTADSAADHNFPTFSPDGNSVLYAGSLTGQFEIYEMPLNGGTPLQLTGPLTEPLTGGQGDSFAPSVSPDGSRIVFTRKVSGGNAIWIMNRDGSDAHQIYGLPQGFGWDPVWSPDGSQVLFTAGTADGGQLYRMNPDGTGLAQISQIENFLSGGSWSPDGTRMAVYAGPAWQHELYLLNPDGTGVQQITQGGNNLSPYFSPDGGWLVFTSYRDRYGDESGCEIYIMRLDGSDVRRLTDNSYCDWQPRWGP